jgi:hypothetical protein
MAPREAEIILTVEKYAPADWCERRRVLRGFRHIPPPAPRKATPIHACAEDVGAGETIWLSGQKKRASTGPLVDLIR